MSQQPSTSGKKTLKALPPSFDVRLTSPLSSSGTYRVFVERNDLIFIQVEGGAAPIIAALAPLLGPAGGLVPLVLWLFTKRKAKVKKERLEEGDPEDLLRENEANFKLYTAEIRDAAVEPRSILAVSGKAGRLNLIVRHGDKIKCEFENPGQMKQAISLLTPLLHLTLKINVQWNEQKGEFEKKKFALGHPSSA